MSLRLAFAAFAALALSGCVSASFFSMSDEWCARHPQASASQCPEGRTSPTVVR